MSKLVFLFFVSCAAFGQTSGTPKFLAAVARTAMGTANTHVLIIGDSTTVGYPYQVYQSWPALTHITNNLSNSPGIAIYGSYTGGTDTRWSIGSGWSNVTSYIGFANLATFTATAGASPLVFTPGSAEGIFDSFKVYYATQTGFGGFTVQATRGSPTTVNANKGSGGIATVTVIAGSAGTGNAVTISSLTGRSTYILAIEPFLSTTKQIYIGNVGIGGSSAYGWSQNTSAFSSLRMIEATVPDLCVISLGGNDAGAMETTVDYISYLQPIINACKVSGDVIVMTPWPSQNAPYSTYEAMYHPALLALGTSNRVPVLDIYGQYGGVYQAALSNDALHPNTAGYQAIANAASVLLTNQALGGTQKGRVRERARTDTVRGRSAAIVPTATAMFFADDSAEVAVRP